MSLLVARQPVFDRKEQVVGYKLLYREAGYESYTCENGDVATSSVITASFLSTTFDSLAGSKKVFVNFTDTFLTEGIATLFPPEQLVIDILETGKNTDEVVAACKKLKSLGYTICVGEFALDANHEMLLNQADIVKINFLERSKNEKREIVQRYSVRNIEFLADKVENYEEYQNAFYWGYTYFQGYFFAKPQIVSSQGIQPSKLNQIRLLSILSEKEFDFAKVADIIEMDTAFSYEILKIANSSYFSRGTQIKTIKHALVRLGMADVKKWCYIAALCKEREGNHDEVINRSMIRAKFLEVLAEELGLKMKKAEYAAVGILSSLDVLLGVPMEKALLEIHLSEELSGTLLGREEAGGTLLTKSYQLILACEEGMWERVVDIAQHINIDLSRIADIHNEAIKWVLNFNQEVLVSS